MKVSVLLKDAKTQLIAAGKQESLVDAEWLMCEVTGLTRTTLQLSGDVLLSDHQVKTFKRYMQKRLDGTPIQYILGIQSFYGYEFEVNANVLIPRFETEELVDRAIRWSRKRAAKTLIDMCTGTGCIGLTVLKECEEMSGHLVDYSPEAISVAKKNRHNLNLEQRCKIWHSDLFEALPDIKVDMVISNPPYIGREIIDTLDIEVKCFEPVMALDGGVDGLDFYRRISVDAKAYLNEGGILMFEIGYDQMQAVSGILEVNGYKEIEGFQDMSGKDRMVMGVR